MYDEIDEVYPVQNHLSTSPHPRGDQHPTLKNPTPQLTRKFYTAMDCDLDENSVPIRPEGSETRKEHMFALIDDIFPEVKAMTVVKTEAPKRSSKGLRGTDSIRNQGSIVRFGTPATCAPVIAATNEAETPSFRSPNFDDSRLLHAGRTPHHSDSLNNSKTSSFNYSHGGFPDESPVPVSSEPSSDCQPRTHEDIVAPDSSQRPARPSAFTEGKVSPATVSANLPKRSSRYSPPVAVQSTNPQYLALLGISPSDASSTASSLRQIAGVSSNFLTGAVSDSDTVTAASMSTDDNRYIPAPVHETPRGFNTSGLHRSRSSSSDEDRESSLIQQATSGAFNATPLAPTSGASVSELSSGSARGRSTFRPGNQSTSRSKSAPSTGSTKRNSPRSPGSTRFSRRGGQISQMMAVDTDSELDTESALMMMHNTPMKKRPPAMDDFASCTPYNLKQSDQVLLQQTIKMLQKVSTSSISSSSTAEHENEPSKVFVSIVAPLVHVPRSHGASGGGLTFELMPTPKNFIVGPTTKTSPPVNVISGLNRRAVPSPGSINASEASSGLEGLAFASPSSANFTGVVSVEAGTHNAVAASLVENYGSDSAESSQGISLTRPVVRGRANRQNAMQAAPAAVSAPAFPFATAAPSASMPAPIPAPAIVTCSATFATHERMTSRVPAPLPVCVWNPSPSPFPHRVDVSSDAHAGADSDTDSVNALPGNASTLSSLTSISNFRTAANPNVHFPSYQQTASAEYSMAVSKRAASPHIALPPFERSPFNPLFVGHQVPATRPPRPQALHTQASEPAIQKSAPTSLVPASTDSGAGLQDKEVTIQPGRDVEQSAESTLPTGVLRTPNGLTTEYTPGFFTFGSGGAETSYMTARELMPSADRSIRGSVMKASSPLRSSATGNSNCVDVSVQCSPSFLSRCGYHAHGEAGGRGPLEDLVTRNINMSLDSSVITPGPPFTRTLYSEVNVSHDEGEPLGLEDILWSSPNIIAQLPQDAASASPSDAAFVAAVLSSAKARESNHCNHSGLSTLSAETLASRAQFDPRMNISIPGTRTTAGKTSSATATSADAATSTESPNTNSPCPASDALSSSSSSSSSQSVPMSLSRSGSNHSLGATSGRSGSRVSASGGPARRVLKSDILDDSLADGYSTSKAIQDIHKFDIDCIVPAGFDGQKESDDDDDDDDHTGRDPEATGGDGIVGHEANNSFDSDMMTASTTISIDQSISPSEFSTSPRLDRTGSARRGTKSGKASLVVSTQRRRRDESQDQKEIVLVAEPGEKAVITLRFKNSKQEKLVMRPRAITMRFDDFHSPRGKIAPSPGETNDAFDVHPKTLEIAQNEDGAMVVSFEPSALRTGIYSGVLKIKAGKKPFVILLRGESKSAVVTPAVLSPAPSFAADRNSASASRTLHHSALSAPVSPAHTHAVNTTVANLLQRLRSPVPPLKEDVLSLSTSAQQVTLSAKKSVSGSSMKARALSATRARTNSRDVTPVSAGKARAVSAVRSGQRDALVLRQKWLRKWIENNKEGIPRLGSFNLNCKTLSVMPETLVLGAVDLVPSRLSSAVGESTAVMTGQLLIRNFADSVAQIGIATSSPLLCVNGADSLSIGPHKDHTVSIMYGSAHVDSSDVDVVSSPNLMNASSLSPHTLMRYGSAPSSPSACHLGYILVTCHDGQEYMVEVRRPTGTVRAPQPGSDDSQQSSTHSIHSTHSVSGDANMLKIAPFTELSESRSDARKGELDALQTSRGMRELTGTNNGLQYKFPFSSQQRAHSGSAAEDVHDRSSSIPLSDLSVVSAVATSVPADTGAVRQAVLPPYGSAIIPAKPYDDDLGSFISLASRTAANSRTVVLPPRPPTSVARATFSSLVSQASPASLPHAPTPAPSPASTAIPTPATVTATASFQNRSYSYAASTAQTSFSSGCSDSQTESYIDGHQNTNSTMQSSFQTASETVVDDDDFTNTSMKRAGVYFRKSKINFGAVEAGTMTKAKIELCNNSDRDVKIFIGEPQLPFVLLHSEVMVRARSYVRVPLRCVPIRGCQKEFSSELIAQTEDGSHHAVVRLVVSSYV